MLIIILANIKLILKTNLIDKQSNISTRMFNKLKISLQAWSFSYYK